VRHLWQLQLLCHAVCWIQRRLPAILQQADDREGGLDVLQQADQSRLVHALLLIYLFSWEGSVTRVWLLLLRGLLMRRLRLQGLAMLLLLLLLLLLATKVPLLLL
jgi:hypothetical protein